MKRVILAFIISLCLLILCTACDSETGPLRICIESPQVKEHFPAESLVYNFLCNAKDYGVIDSVEDVEIEVIPGGYDADEERKGALTRLLTEIASGKGPDIFLIGHPTGGGFWGNDTLFRYPERAMAQKRFLKLDDYIGNAQFMEWDKLLAPVMEAGKTESGQFLLPMTYSFQVTIYNTPDAPIGLTPETTWYDMQKSSDQLVRYAAQIPEGFVGDGLNNMFGRITVGQSDTLTLSKEQLGSIYATRPSLEPEGLPESFHTDLRVNFDEPGMSVPTELREWDMKMVPMCSLDGGVTATVTSFCGINANTKYPEEAFALLDLLLSKEFQQHSGVFSMFLQEGLPVYDGLVREESPAQHWYFLEKNYQAFLDARSLITCAKFWTPADRALCYGYRTWTPGNAEEVVDETYRDIEMGLAES